MKIIKIIQEHRSVSANDIRTFIERNMAQEMINGLEQDDPTTIARALRMLGIHNATIPDVEYAPHDHEGG